MERQMSFSEMEFANKNRTTRKEKFLSEMARVLPWTGWCKTIQPYYFEKGNGREPTPLITMLKMYLLSLWYNMSDESCEDAIHDTHSFKNFIGEHVPDATTLCKFRKMLERNKLNKKIFQQEVETLKAHGIIREQGTIVDATIISAPDSNKNKERKRNPEFNSTFKGKEVTFGMKSHIGVDEDSGLVHSAFSTVAKESDVANAGYVVHGKEERVRGDAGYIGIQKQDEICKKFQDGSGEMEIVKRKSDKQFEVHKKRENIEFIVNRKRCQITEETKPEEQVKTRVRSKVEHIFLILKHLFGFRKVRLRTLIANDERLHMYYALVNIYKVSKMGCPQKPMENAILLAA